MGERQGDWTSPFNIILEEALGKVKISKVGIRIGNKINILSSAHSVAILTNTEEDLNDLIKRLIEKVDLKKGPGVTLHNFFTAHK